MRENLSAIEEAEGYQRLINEFSHTQEALAQIIGKSRSHIANTLRLLSLPATVQELVKEGKLSAGHARALVGLDNAENLAKQIMEKDLNVRQVEDLVARQKEPKAPKTPKEKNGDLADIEKELVNVFAAVGSFSLSPDKDEVDEGKYWEIGAIEENTGRSVLTPNFEQEFVRVKDRLLALL